MKMKVGLKWVVLVWVGFLGVVAQGAVDLDPRVYYSMADKLILDAEKPFEPKVITNMDDAKQKLFASFLLAHVLLGKPWNMPVTQQQIVEDTVGMMNDFYVVFEINSADINSIPPEERAEKKSTFINWLDALKAHVLTLGVDDFLLDYFDKNGLPSPIKKAICH